MRLGCTLNKPNCKEASRLTCSVNTTASEVGGREDRVGREPKRGVQCSLPSGLGLFCLLKGTQMFVPLGSEVLLPEIAPDEPTSIQDHAREAHCSMTWGNESL